MLTLRPLLLLLQSESVRLRWAGLALLHLPLPVSLLLRTLSGPLALCLSGGSCASTLGIRQQLVLELRLGLLRLLARLVRIRSGLITDSSVASSVGSRCVLGVRLPSRLPLEVRGGWTSTSAVGIGTGHRVGVAAV